MPPAVVIAPQTSPRVQGCPRPLRTPSSESASAKPMVMPAPMEAAMPTRNAVQLLCEANAAANTGARVDTRAVHQAGQARLDDLQHEAPALGLVLLLPRSPDDLLLFVHRPGQVVVLGFLRREVAEELADGGVAGPGGGRADRRCGLPRSIVSTSRRTMGYGQKRVGNHCGLRAMKPLHVLAADQRDVLAESRPGTGR